MRAELGLYEILGLGLVSWISHIIKGFSWVFPLVGFFPSLEPTPLCYLSLVIFMFYILVIL